MKQLVLHDVRSSPSWHPFLMCCNCLCLQHIQRIFSQYGEVESVRCRSISFENPKLPRKAAFILKNFHQDRDSMNAYVVFKNKETVDKALAYNGELIGDKHVRVDRADTELVGYCTSLSSPFLPLASLSLSLYISVCLCLSFSSLPPPPLPLRLFLISRA